MHKSTDRKYMGRRQRGGDVMEGKSLKMDIISWVLRDE